MISALKMLYMITYLDACQKIEFTSLSKPLCIRVHWNSVQKYFNYCK
jgi:hypothetical protein